MRYWGIGLAFALATIAASAQAEVRVCKDGEYQNAEWAGWDESKDHAQFQIPPITYDHPKTSTIGLQLEFVVDKEGRIVCMAWPEVRTALDETPERHALLAQMDDWRFKPFLKKGQLVQAAVSIFLNEKIDFHFHEDMPAVPASDMTITLTRSSCHGWCPTYSVTLRGNGWVEFNGSGYTAVMGKHVYTVDPALVAALRQDMQANDVWSMAGNWVGHGSDAPTYSMDVTIGGERRHFEDYFGKEVGMPSAVSDLMNAVDRISRTKAFIHLSVFSVQQLEHEGFDFRSQKGANLFFQAVNDADSEDAALLRLIDLGTPVLTGQADKESPYPWPSEPPLEAALMNRHSGLIEPLIAMGTLNTDGKPDQAKVDAAFQAAIAGGRLAAVQRIWQQAGTRPHPSLYFIQKDEIGETSKRASVTLLLTGDVHDPDWEGLAIAQWLIAQGCDVHATDVYGQGLLAIAVRADDIPMVQYLIAQGTDAVTLTAALGSVIRDEDMAMLLIEAGADPWKFETGTYNFTHFAKGNGWTRVLAWMDAHKPQGQDASAPKS